MNEDVKQEIKELTGNQHQIVKVESQLTEMMKIFTEFHKKSSDAHIWTAQRILSIYKILSLIILILGVVVFYLERTMIKFIVFTIYHDAWIKMSERWQDFLAYSLVTLLIGLFCSWFSYFLLKKK